MDFRYDRIKTMLSILKPKICEQSIKLEDILYKDCGYKENNVLPKIDDSWTPIDDVKKPLYEKDSHAWIYIKFKVPEQMKGKEIEVLVPPLNTDTWASAAPQSIAYVNGELTQGIDINHQNIFLDGKSEEYEIYLYVYGTMSEGSMTFALSLNSIDKDVEQLYYDLYVPFNVLEFTNPIDKEYTDILCYLDNCINLLDLRIYPSKEFNESVIKAHDYIKTEFYEKYCRKQDHSIICVGHTHIDVAWLWTLDQTKEKVQRSFSTVVSLMKKYPEYKFISSQAQLYEFLKAESPETYENVKKLVAEGRWEVEGSMWVEADCNLTSGESLVRQVMHGKRFFKKEFNVDTKILWLPDVFGYSAALPQILRKCGVDKFVTSKISWNETNQMPYDTFEWIGLDGTKILSYFLTAQNKKIGADPVRFTTYNATTEPKQIAGTWDRYQQKDLYNKAFLPFGFGDGGGGPTKHQLELLRRMSYGIPGLPNTEISTATQFFDELKKSTENNTRLPQWVGELYLEYHRGTYTSIAKNKKNNRQCEFLYLFTELMSCIDVVLNNGIYPENELLDDLKIIMLNQFHDIIPGSSIKEVYETSDKQYAQIRRSMEAIRSGVFKRISDRINTDGGILVFNPHSFTNSDVVTVDGKALYVKDIPAKGYRVIKPIENKHTVEVTDKTITNTFFIVEFNDNYEISRIYDKKNNREVLENGKVGNDLWAFEDFPRDFDAWEITNYYKEKSWHINEVVSCEIVHNGARAGLKVTKKFLNSTICQYIYLYDDIDKIDFVNEIDWHEEHILVKTAFPVNIHSEKATYDTQFGSIERPTHQNTSWDAAKFEVCTHKFVDLSEYDYGISLLNDCKYGHDVLGNTIRMTLLKCATYPNPDADKGHHSFTFSLYPHAGGYRDAETVRLAYNLNMPMTAVNVENHQGDLPEEYSFLSCDRKNVIVETVKKAEDSNDIIIRLNECYNSHCLSRISFGFDVKKVFACDLMENELNEIPIFENSVELSVSPFEIITLKISR